MWWSSNGGGTSSSPAGSSSTARSGGSVGVGAISNIDQAVSIICGEPLTTERQEQSPRNHNTTAATMQYDKNFLLNKSNTTGGISNVMHDNSASANGFFFRRTFSAGSSQGGSRNHSSNNNDLLDGCGSNHSTTNRRGGGGLGGAFGTGGGGGGGPNHDHRQRVSRKQRRRSSGGASRANAFLACSIAHLEQFIDSETMPFVAQSDLPTSSVIGMAELKIGKLIGEGDFTKTQEIKGFKFAKQRLLASHSYPVFGISHQPKEKGGSGGGGSGGGSGSDDNSNVYRDYAIKSLNNKLLHDPTTLSNLEANSVQEAYQTAVQRLVKETLYLAALAAGTQTSPFILAFRGFWMSDTQSYQDQQLDLCHLITDRLGETLEERMKTWKFHRQRREREDTNAKFILESVQMDLNTPLTTNLMMHKSKRPRTRPNAAQLHDPTDNNLSKSRHKLRHQLPKLEHYPDDLVALQTNYVLQIAHALEFLHARGIVVRDLRPNTIGFKEYPLHHTIQLFHFGHCQEIPRNSPQGEDAWVEPQFIRALQGGHLSVSCNQSCNQENDDSTHNNNNNHIRRMLSRDVVPVSGGRSPRAEAKHYRAPESYPLVRPPPTRRGGADGNVMILAQQDSLHRIHTGGTTVTRTHTNITCTTKTLARNNIPVVLSSSSPSSATTSDIADDGDNDANTTTTNNGGGVGGAGGAGAGSSYFGGYQYRGYNCKADIYSLMMIYYEMLAESKPFGRNIITREGHYYRVQTHGLRPALNKHHFPRTIKAVLEGGWDPVIEERYSAMQIRQLLTTILPMLEGKGLPLGGSGTTTTTSGGGSGGNNRSNNKDVGTSLPARAAALLVPHNAGNGWNSVWSRTNAGSKRLDSKQVMDTIQAHRIGQAKQKNRNNNNKTNNNNKAISTTSVPKVARSMLRSKSLKDWLPSFKMSGMVKNEMNARTAKLLLGDAAYNDKQRRLANTEALKKQVAYY